MLEIDIERERGRDRTRERCIQRERARESGRGAEGWRAMREGKKGGVGEEKKGGEVG